MRGVIEELSRNHPNQHFEYFVCEAGLPAAELSARLGQLVEVLKERPVGLLVNNVGRTEGVFGWFGDQDSDWSDEEAEADGKGERIVI